MIPRFAVVPLETDHSKIVNLYRDSELTVLWVLVIDLLWILFLFFGFIDEFLL